MDAHYLAALLFILGGSLISWRSWYQASKGNFYRETPWGWPLGIFVWGDGIVLGCWWALVGLSALWITPLWLWRIFLLFWMMRSGYEVMYWLNHQAVKSQEIPPLLRGVKWVSPNEAAILYQVGQMCVSVSALIGLLLTTKL